MRARIYTQGVNATYQADGSFDPLDRGVLDLDQALAILDMLPECLINDSMYCPPAVGLSVEGPCPNVARLRGQHYYLFLIGDCSTHTDLPGARMFLRQAFEKFATVEP